MTGATLNGFARDANNRPSIEKRPFKSPSSAQVLIRGVVCFLLALSGIGRHIAGRPEPVSVLKRGVRVSLAWINVACCLFDRLRIEAP
jgi:hypothetical protein